MNVWSLNGSMFKIHTLETCMNDIMNKTSEYHAG